MKLDASVVKLVSIHRYSSLEDDFNKVHNYKYTYDKSVYIKQSIPIIITCKLHGDFLQTPNNHLSGHGCKKCYELTKIKYTKDTFIEKANTIHNCIYNYDLIENAKLLGKVPIVCNNHGVFYQTPRNHIELKQKCPKCADIHRGLLTRKSLDDWIVSARNKHGDRYNYDYVVLDSYNTYVTIVCPVHGGFKQKASNHISGVGCKYCNSVRNYNNYYNVPTSLYYIKISKDGDIKYKIGITTKNVKIRYRGYNGYNIDEIFYYRFNSGNKAFLAEQHLINKYKTYITKDKNYIKNGVTEVFDIDIIDKYTFDSVVNIYKEVTNEYSVLHRF